MKSTLHAALTVVLLLGSGLALAGDSKVNLTGKEEVPAVETAATGSGTITVGADKPVSGSVTTKGIEGNAAHIHQAAMGKNGPPIIVLEKGADGKPTDAAVRRIDSKRSQSRRDRNQLEPRRGRSAMASS